MLLYYNILHYTTLYYIILYYMCYVALSRSDSKSRTGSKSRSGSKAAVIGICIPMYKILGQ